MKKKRSKQGRLGDQVRFSLNTASEGDTRAEKNASENGLISNVENRKEKGKEVQKSGELAEQTNDFTRKDDSKKRGEGGIK